MEFLNYILDKVEPIKNAADLLILILMGFCSVHSVKDSREKAAKKVAAIVLGIMFCAGLTAGCGQKQTDQANVPHLY